MWYLLLESAARPGRPHDGALKELGSAEFTEAFKQGGSRSRLGG